MVQQIAGEVDFALAAYHDGGAWQVAELSLDHAADIESLAEALRRLPGESGAVGMVAVEEDFFVLVRVAGETTRVLLSDAGAAVDWELAADAVDFLGLPDVADPLLDDAGPAGDLGLLTDLGLGSVELAELIDDEDDDDDLYPDEVLSDVAQHLGFGALFDDAVGLSPA